MSSGARAAIRSSRNGSFVSNLIYGGILIILGLFQERERFKALSIVTGVVIILLPVFNSFRSSASQPKQYDSISEKITDEKEREEKHRSRKNLFRKLFLLSVPVLIFTFEYFNTESGIGFQISFWIFITLLLSSALFLYLWNTQWEKWQEVYPEVLKRDLREMSQEDRDNYHDRIKKRMYIFLGLWLGMWAVNWIVFFTDLFFTFIGFVLFAISLSGFIFMFFAWNAMKAEGRVANAIASI